MDCESPLDDQLYNVGVRLSFQYHDKPIEISIVADPSDFTFSLSSLGLPVATHVCENPRSGLESIPCTVHDRL